MGSAVMMVTGVLILLGVGVHRVFGNSVVSYQAYQGQNYYTQPHEYHYNTDSLSYSNEKLESYQQKRQDRQVDAIEISEENYNEGIDGFGFDYDQDKNKGAQDDTLSQSLNSEDKKKFGSGVGASHFGQNVVPSRNKNPPNNDNRFGFGVGISNFGQNVLPSRNRYYKKPLNNDKRFGFGVGVSQFGNNVVPARTKNDKKPLNNNKRFGFGVGVGQFGQNVVPARKQKKKTPLDNDKRFGFGVGVSNFGQNVVPAGNNQKKIDDDKRFGFGVGVSPFVKNIIPGSKTELNNDKRFEFGADVSQFVQNALTNDDAVVLDSDESKNDRDGNNEKRFSAGVSSFIPNPTQGASNEGGEENLTPWQKAQKRRIQEAVKKVNATFIPVQQYFNYSYLTGHDPEDEVYHVGSIGKFFGERILSLPDLLSKDRPFTEFWKYLVDTEENNLQNKIQSRIAAGEPLYTNRNREGGFVYEFIEKNPWWHENLAFCTQSQTERFSPKSLACSLLIDFGLTILIELIFMKDLVICTGLLYLTGDTSLCLALYVSKLAFPTWYSQNTPWMANNVHLN